MGRFRFCRNRRMRGLYAERRDELLSYATQYLGDKLRLELDAVAMGKSLAVGSTCEFVLEHLPPCLHLVITTRADPPLPKK